MRGLLEPRGAVRGVWVPPDGYDRPGRFATDQLYYRVEDGRGPLLMVSSRLLREAGQGEARVGDVARLGVMRLRLLVPLVRARRSIAILRTACYWIAEEWGLAAVPAGVIPGRAHLKWPWGKR